MSKNHIICPLPYKGYFGASSGQTFELENFYSKEEILEVSHIYII
jgi:hypothetical protein